MQPSILDFSLLSVSVPPGGTVRGRINWNIIGTANHTYTLVILYGTYSATGFSYWGYTTKQVAGFEQSRYDDLDYTIPADPTFVGTWDAMAIICESFDGGISGAYDFKIIEDALITPALNTMDIYCYEWAYRNETLPFIIYDDVTADELENVEIKCVELNRTVYTNSNGYVEMAGIEELGRYTFKFTKPGYYSETRYIDIVKRPLPADIDNISGVFLEYSVGQGINATKPPSIINPTRSFSPGQWAYLLLLFNDFIAPSDIPVNCKWYFDDTNQKLTDGDQTIKAGNWTWYSLGWGFNAQQKGVYRIEIRPSGTPMSGELIIYYEIE